MNIYPFSSPIILNESMYAEYGGQSGSATPSQLQNSFLIAEQRASKYIGTLLLPTIVTGTFPYNSQQFIATDYGYVSRILSATLLSIDSLTDCTLREDSGCTFVFNDTFGYINFSCAKSICSSCFPIDYPYQFRIAYECGLPTGTASQAPIEHALVIVAEEALQEMLYPRANESAGARGITEWRSLEYSEKRKPLKRTALGQSARANYAAELIDACVVKARRAIMVR